MEKLGRPAEPRMGALHDTPARYLTMGTTPNLLGRRVDRLKHVCHGRADLFIFFIKVLLPRLMSSLSSSLSIWQQY